MAELTYPEELKYTKDHEWTKTEGDAVIIGITAFAQDQLGEVVFVELPEPGTEIKAGEPFGVVESTKAVSELFAPISGTVIERNDPLIDSPDSLNEDPYEEGWMIKVKPADASEVGKLLDQAAYVDFLEEQSE